MPTPLKSEVCFNPTDLMREAALQIELIKEREQSNDPVKIIKSVIELAKLVRMAELIVHKANFASPRDEAIWWDNLKEAEATLGEYQHRLLTLIPARAEVSLAISPDIKEKTRAKRQYIGGNGAYKGTIPTSEWSAIGDAYTKGMSAREIGEATGFGQHAINNLLHFLKVPLRGRGGSKNTK